LLCELWQIPLISAFEATGVSPFNLKRPVASAFGLKPLPPEVFRTRTTGAEINDLLVTSSECLETVCQIERRGGLLASNFEADMRPVWERVIKLPS
jgi:hypothetical protein